jgi:hypothetical protein
MKIYGFKTTPYSNAIHNISVLKYYFLKGSSWCTQESYIFIKLFVWTLFRSMINEFTLYIHKDLLLQSITIFQPCAKSTHFQKIIPYQLSMMHSWIIQIIKQHWTSFIFMYDTIIYTLYSWGSIVAKWYHFPTMYQRSRASVRVAVRLGRVRASEKRAPNASDFHQLKFTDENYFSQNIRPRPTASDRPTFFRTWLRTRLRPNAIGLAVRRNLASVLVRHVAKRSLERYCSPREPAIFFGRYCTDSPQSSCCLSPIQQLFHHLLQYTSDS